MAIISCSYEPVVYFHSYNLQMMFIGVVLISPRIVLVTSLRYFYYYRKVLPSRLSVGLPPSASLAHLAEESPSMPSS